MSTCKATVILGEHDICKDCMKADVCIHKTNLDKDPIIGMSVEQCEYFKDKSKVIELLCKVGEKVYTPVDGEVEEYRIAAIFMEKNDFYTEVSFKCDKIFKHTIYEPDKRSKHIKFGPRYINNKIFLTREEAEQALRRVKTNNSE